MLTGLVTLNSIQKEVPLPDKLTQWTLGQIIGETYQAEWASAVFDLRGGLYLRDFRLMHSRETESVLEAEMIRIDFAFFDLLFGLPFPLDEIHSTGISIFIPASKSPSGLNEPVLRISHAHLLRKDQQLIVDYLNFNAQGLRFYLSGSCPLAPLSAPEKEATSLTSPEFFTDLLARIHRLPEDIDLDCFIQWSTPDARNHRFDLFLLSDVLTLPMAQLEEVSFKARMQISPGALTLTGLHGQGILSFINPKAIPPALVPWPLAPPIPISFSATGPPVEFGFLDAPRQLRIDLKNPFSENFPVEVLIAETALGEMNPRINWSLGGRELFASGSAQQVLSTDAPPPDLAEAPWSVHLRADFRNPVLHEFFPELPYHRLLENSRADRLRLDASLYTDSKSISGVLFSDQLHIGKTDFAHLKSDFSLSATNLDLTRIHVQRSGKEFAMGSYFHHFPSSRFSLNAYGSSFPDSLNTILGSWWPGIFTHVQTGQPLPADVSVWGHWRERSSLKSVTAVRGRGVKYRGMPVEELRVRVRSNKEWAYLEALSGQFATGRIEGTLAWRTGKEDDTGERAMLMDLKSDAPWEAVQAASGVEALKQLDLAGNPELHVKGVLWNTGEDGEEAGTLIPDLKIDLSHRNAVSEIGGWRLSSLALSGKVTRDQVDLRRLSGRLAGGIFTGSLEIVNWQEPENLKKHINLQLIDAGYLETLRQAVPEGKDSSLFKEALASDSGGGKIDTSLDLWLEPDIRNNRGTGQITLRNAEIGQIHLFGGLSRFLSGIGLGFSTLNLDSGSIDWGLEDGQLTIADCLLKGSVLNLNLSGKVDIIEKKLQMQADAYFFKGLVSRMLTPVSDNFQFDITGPLENPIWKLRLNPLRWFQNRFPLPSEPKPFQTAPD